MAIMNYQYCPKHDMGHSGICPQCYDEVFGKEQKQKTIIHTTSGSQLTYEKESRDRPMAKNYEKDEQMELPNALKKDNPNPSGDQIKGYRKLSDLEVRKINELKNLAIAVGEVVKELENHDIDKQWLAIGRTDLQTGFMALIRSIAKPETF